MNRIVTSGTQDDIEVGRCSDRHDGDGCEGRAQHHAGGNDSRMPTVA